MWPSLKLVKTFSVSTRSENICHLKDVRPSSYWQLFSTGNSTQIKDGRVRETLSLAAVLLLLVLHDSESGMCCSWLDSFVSHVFVSATFYQTCPTSVSDRCHTHSCQGRSISQSTDQQINQVPSPQLRFLAMDVHHYISLAIVVHSNRLLRASANRYDPGRSSGSQAGLTLARF